jgi:hypothetical protein
MESWLVRRIREQVVIGLLRGMERQRLKPADWRPPLLAVEQRSVLENRPVLAK